MPIIYTEVVKKATATGVTGLWRVTFDDPREKFWVGALRWNKMGADHKFQVGALGNIATVNGVPRRVRPINHTTAEPWYDNSRKTPTPPSMPDSLFYVEEKSNGSNLIKVVSSPHGWAQDALWDFQPYKFVNSLNEQSNFWGIVANGQSNLLQMRRVEESGVIKPWFYPFYPNNAALNSFDPTLASDVSGIGAATFAITNVRHLALYNGSMVYAGFSSWDPQNDDPAQLENFPHWAVFSDTVGTDYSAYSIDTTTSFSVGDDASEPITGAVVNSVVTDVMGIKGQLLLFTPRKIVTFEGLPPLPGGEASASFLSPLPPSPIGTWATRTIVRTPVGIMFLAADGLVYLIPYQGLPVPVGRALEPHFRKLNEFQMKHSAAVYVDGHYVLSVPDPERDTLTTYETWFGDLRNMRISEFDAGVQWMGPQMMPPISVYAAGYGLGDLREVKGGSAVSSQIFDVWREDVFTDAPTRNANPDLTSPVLAKQLGIQPHAVSNPLDLGDVHADKMVVNATVMVGTHNKSDVSISVSAISVAEQSGELAVNHQTNNVTIQPQLGLLGGTTLVLPAEETTQPLHLHPDDRLFGRMFVIEFKEETNSGADKDTAPFFEDLTFSVIPVARRI